MKSLKIVVDIGHPAHVHFFKNFIWEMEKRGHQILVTASQKDITFRLLDNYKIKYTNLGSYGKSVVEKFFNIGVMDIRMLNAVKDFNPDILMGIGSLRAAHVSKILKKYCIIFDDSEPASAGQAIYLPFIDLVLTPDCFRKELGPKQRRYKGYHELAYLNSRYFKPNHTVLKALKIESDQKYFILRFVSWKAGHDIGRYGLSDKEKVQLVEYLVQFGQVLISAEGDLPEKLKPYVFKIPPEKMHDALSFATLFITDSQTMATEAAILGTPTIRCNSFVGSNDMGNFIELEKKYGLMFSFNKFKDAMIKIADLLKKNNLKVQWHKRKDKLLTDKIDVTAMMVKLAEDYAKNETKSK